MTKNAAKWTNDFEIRSGQRTKILEKFNDILKRWKLKMPRGKPLVIDFGLGNFYEMGLIEFWVANEKKEGYCGKFLFVFDGQTCPYHHHNYKHETFFVVKGKAKMKVDGKYIVKKEGGLLMMPKRVKHSFTGIGHSLLLEVSKPCIPGDSIFQEKRIGKEGVI